MDSEYGIMDFENKFCSYTPQALWSKNSVHNPFLFLCTFPFLYPRMETPRLHTSIPLAKIYPNIRPKHSDPKYKIVMWWDSVRIMEFECGFCVKIMEFECEMVQTTRFV